MLLLAFNHEIARAREVTREPTLALIRLQWWREVVEGARRSHPVATPLADALAEGRIAPADLLAMLDGREAEAEMPDLATFLAYVEGTAGALAVAAGRVLGGDAATLARLRAVGAAYGVAGQLRAVGVLARQGRCLLPADTLGSEGLTPEAVVGRPDDPRLRPVFAALAGKGRERLVAGAGRFPRDVLAAALPGVLARRDLRRAERGMASPAPRGVAERAAVVLAAARGRV